MYKCVFTFVNNNFDYININNKKIDYIFSNKNYGDNCLVLNKKVYLIDCFNYFYKKNNYSDYIFISSKCSLKNNFDHLFKDEFFYLNYQDSFIYFLKYGKHLYKVFHLLEHRINSDNLINFLSDYYSSFQYKINKDLSGKFVFPKNKLIYNGLDEKFKNKRSKSI